LRSAAIEAAVVFTVSVEVTAPVPDIAAGCVAEQVGMSIAPAGLAVTAHVSATVPVNPPLGVTVIVEVPLAPGDDTLTAVPLRAKLGLTTDAFTVIGTFVVSVTLPETPVTVTV